MLSPEELNAILDRLVECRQTEADIVALHQALSEVVSGVSLEQQQVIIQLGKYNVNIGESKELRIGDRAYIEINDATIQALVKTIQQYICAAEDKQKPIGIPHNLPRSGVKQFVGRDLAQLHHQLCQAARLAITAIRGMGGIGKTELALQYACYHLQQGTYSGGICWLRAKDQEIATQIVSFTRSSLGLALSDDLKLLEQIAYCWQHWPEGEVLVVIDDVDDYEAIAPYLPPQDPRFCVLLTTRLQLGSSIQTFEITVLNEAAALKLLMSLIGVERIEAELETAKALCEWLGYLPLGLELVGRYLAQKPDLSLKKLQTRLNSQRLSARALSRRQSDMTAVHESVTAAIELSWQMLKESEQQLAFVLSQFALAPIPWSMVIPFFKDIDEEDLEDDRDQGLVNCSLLQRVEQDTYQLHQLIREFVQAKLETSPQAEGLKQHFCEQMVQRAQDISNTLTLKQVLGFAPAVPHLAEAATTLQDWISDDNLIWPFIGLGRFYIGQGAYAQAELWCEACLSATRSRLDDKHPYVALNLNNLATLYSEQGQYGKAEPLFVESLNLYRSLLGNDHPALASSLSNLAKLYHYQGRYREAEPLFIKSLEMERQLLDNGSPDVTQNLNSLAELYREQGRHGEAEPLFIESLEMRRQLLGNEHPAVAQSLNSLAELYREQGRYREAEPLFIESLALFRHLSGNKHPNVALILNNLALLYSEQGQYRKAEPLFVESLGLYKRLLGNDHPDIAISLQNLANLYRDQGQSGKAESLYIKSLRLFRKRLGNDHPSIATNLHNLALLYSAQGRCGEAESRFIEALEMRRRLLGNDHPDIATSLNHLAELYCSQKRYWEAKLLCLEALKIAEDRLGANHPYTQTFRQSYEICQRLMQSVDPTDV